MAYNRELYIKGGIVMLNFLAKHKTLIAASIGYLLYDFLSTKKKEKMILEETNCTTELPAETEINEEVKTEEIDSK